MRVRQINPAALIRRCELAGMTRADVARAAGVARSTITHLASGERASARVGPPWMGYSARSTWPQGPRMTGRSDARRRCVAHDAKAFASRTMVGHQRQSRTRRHPAQHLRRLRTTV
ncbi:helix-turn-helix transcriptional regulator [Lysobacter sp. OAE881]|uniref:helix-turn-helix domain-containing protein n=1 Tax=Lysobacter sp. OAE881 TaxID=2663813 RepID=UPI001789F3AA